MPDDLLPPRPRLARLACGRVVRDDDPSLASPSLVYLLARPRSLLRASLRFTGGAPSLSHSSLSSTPLLHGAESSGSAETDSEGTAVSSRSLPAGSDSISDPLEGRQEHELFMQPPHLPPVREVLVSPLASNHWLEAGGAELRPLLESGAIALLDAHWLLAQGALGGVLQPRQALPNEAFLSFNELQEASYELQLHSPALPIVCVSLPWKRPRHPDPDGHNLKILARALYLLLDDLRGMTPNCRLGVFIDFCSIHQRCRDATGTACPEGLTWENGAPLTPGAIGRFAIEHELFKQALDGLCMFFSHPSTLVVLLTQMPPDVNETSSGQCGPPTDHWRTPFFDRGWCFCETAWASIVKDPHLVLDLGQLGHWNEYESSNDGELDEHDSFQLGSLSTSASDGDPGVPPLLDNTEAVFDAMPATWDALVDQCMHSRRIPMTPAVFEAQLQHKAFSDGTADRPRVTAMYRSEFEARFGAIEELDYERCGWGDAQAASVANLLTQVSVPRLQRLSFLRNCLGDEGACAIAAALPAAQRLSELYLGFNSIGHRGATALAAATPLMPYLTGLYLDSNIIGDGGASAIASAMGAMPQLHALWLGHNCVGDAGAISLARALPSCPTLAELYLGMNHVGDAGASALAAALQDTPNLIKLYLCSNSVGDAGASAFASVLREAHGPEELFLGRNLIGDAGVLALARAMQLLSRGESCPLGEGEGDRKRECAPPKRLKLLRIEHNSFGEEAGQALLAACDLHQIRLMLR